MNEPVDLTTADMLLRLAIGTWFWVLGIIVGCATVVILFLADRLSYQQGSTEDNHEADPKH